MQIKNKQLFESFIENDRFQINSYLTFLFYHLEYKLEKIDTEKNRPEELENSKN